MKPRPATDTEGGGRAIESVEPWTLVDPAPSAAPIASTPPTSGDNVGDKLARLEHEKKTLIEQENAARKEAKDLLRRAAELETSADEMQRRRETVEQDIAKTREAMEYLAALDLDMAKLLANREEILRRLRS